MNGFRYLSLYLLVIIFGSIQPILAAELVGLQNVVLEPEERVWGFEIHQQEGRIVSMCTVPEGWKVTAENYGEAAEYKDGGGKVQGDADFGHDALSSKDMSELCGLLLIDRSTVHNKSAKLTGFVMISGPSDNRKVDLQPQNFLRRKAGQCPVPPTLNHRTRP